MRAPLGADAWLLSLVRWVVANPTVLALRSGSPRMTAKLLSFLGSRLLIYRTDQPVAPSVPRAVPRTRHTPLPALLGAGFLL